MSPKWSDTLLAHAFLFFSKPLSFCLLAEQSPEEKGPSQWGGGGERDVRAQEGGSVCRLGPCSVSCAGAMHKLD